MPVHIPAQIRDASHSLHLTSQCKVYFADASKDVQKIADRIALSCATALEVNFNSGSIQGLDDTHLRCSLFSSLVQPVLSYGCEVWCLERLSLFSQMNTVHNHFMKRTTCAQVCSGWHCFMRTGKSAIAITLAQNGTQVCQQA